LEGEEGPFVTDKYILPDEWSGLGRMYILSVGIPARNIALSDTFNGIILVAIIIAGLLVGIQTYAGMETNTVVVTIDNVILVTFCVEITLKMCGEGLAPWRYFTSKEWRWNNFDFIIVMLCMPFVDLGNSIALLRLFRLMRLAKLVRKVPQLQMIIMGLVGGLSSIGYILLLLFLVFYLFAIAGIYAFRENDPWHYGDLWTALLTLFRASTLEDWTDIMYINMFGCDTYMNIYISDEARQPDNREYWCTFPQEKYWLTQIYFLFFIIISALVMLSLFVGAVTMSMTESMDEMKKEDEEKNKAKMKAKQLKKLAESSSVRGGGFEKSNSGVGKDSASVRSSRRSSTNRLSIIVGLGDVEGEKIAETSRMQKLMLGAWEGIDLTTLMNEDLKTFENPIRNAYYKAAMKSKTVVEDER
jgi:voltage-gated sodium channel